MKSYLLALLFLLIFGLSNAQSGPETPGLEFVCDLYVELSEPYIVGQTPHGLRRIILIVGGRVEGPEVNGTILPGGADWQIVRDDGVAELEAHYQFTTNDGVTIYIKNTGMRVASAEVVAKINRGEPVAPTDYYFCATPSFNAPKGKYEWMNNAIFICKGEKNPDNVLIRVWRVL